MKTKKKISKYPWGKAELLTTGTNYKIKNIIVKPSQRQSYQTHAKRAEAWIILSGEGKITIDDEETKVGPAEDDIVRYEDDYGRHLDNWADVDADLL